MEYQNFKIPGLLIVALACTVIMAGAPDDDQSPITSKVEETDAGELILVETVIVPASLDVVWAAYTTKAGYTSWAAPVAEVDFRVGGTIRTHYGQGAKIGDPGTITLRVVNYAPKRILTLQADVTENWPEILKSQAEHLYNVILFERVTDKKTRVVSYGLGHRDNKEMREMMSFFVSANKGLYAKLIKSVE